MKLLKAAFSEAWEQDDKGEFGFSSVLYYVGALMGRSVEGDAAEGHDARSSAPLSTITQHSPMHWRVETDYWITGKLGKLRNFLGKRGKKQMGPNLKRNKTPIVLSCIFWKITLPPSNPFTFRNHLFEEMPYPLIHEIHGERWQRKYVLLGMTVFSWVSRPRTGLIQHSQLACTKVSASFVKEIAVRIKLDSPWGSHWFHLSAGGRARCLDMLCSAHQLGCWKALGVLLGGGHILTAAGSQPLLAHLVFFWFSAIGM